MERGAPPLSRRLRMVADFVKLCFPDGGVTLADVGTDHAYLPAALIAEGTVARAVASDIREGPLAHARATLESCGMTDRAELLLTDGLDGIELREPDVVVIAGMGGDTIADIIGRAAFLRDGARLILQPMTAADRLRKYLSESGFVINREGVAYDEGRDKSKPYRCLCARFDGVPRTLTRLELELGVAGAARYESEPGAFSRLVADTIRRIETVAAGRERGGGDASAERALLAEMYGLTG